eukprot:m.218634 g.218634  ORF g.218634 m.218634 type:complete len:487 (-) comp15607_c1_seq13:94-1554(-)
MEQQAVPMVQDAGQGDLMAQVRAYMQQQDAQIQAQNARGAQLEQMIQQLILRMDQQAAAQQPLPPDPAPPQPAAAAAIAAAAEAGVPVVMVRDVGMPKLSGDKLNVRAFAAWKNQISVAAADMPVRQAWRQCISALEGAYRNALPEGLVEVPAGVATVADIGLYLARQMFAVENKADVDLRFETNVRQVYKDDMGVEKFIEMFRDELAATILPPGQQLTEGEKVLLFLRCANRSDLLPAMKTMVGWRDDLTQVPTLNMLFEIARSTKGIKRFAPSSFGAALETGPVPMDVNAVSSHKHGRGGPGRGFGRGAGAGAGRDERRCYRCGALGHIQMHCKAKGGKNWGGAKNKSKAYVRGIDDGESGDEGDFSLDSRGDSVFQSMKSRDYPVVSRLSQAHQHHTITHEKAIHGKSKRLEESVDMVVVPEPGKQGEKMMFRGLVRDMRGNEQSVKVLVDSGATRNMVAERLVGTLQTQTGRHSTIFRFADG